jgi:hypothetical protein
MTAHPRLSLLVCAIAGSLFASARASAAPEPITPEPELMQPEPAPEPEPTPEPASEPEPEPDEPEPEPDDGFGADADEPEPPDFRTPTDQLVTVPGAARWKEPPRLVGPSGNPRHSLVYKNLTALRFNALGFVNELTIGYRLQMIDKPSVLFRDSYFGAKVHAWVTPAYGRVGPRIEFQPLALLNINASYEISGYYSTFGLFQSFPSPTSDYSDTVIDDLQDAGTEYATWGQYANVGALLQAKAGPIAVRNNLQFHWADYEMRAGDRVFYSQMLDIAQGDRGWALSNDLDLIYLLGKAKIAARYTLTHAFYREEHYRPFEPVIDPNGPTHRLGPGLLYTFFDRPDARFNRPTAILLAQWWIQHRYRTGQDVHQAIPQVVIAFTFDGEILPDPKRRPVQRQKKGAR